VTDHLEPYRRMARSIKFFPPLSLSQSSQEPVPVTQLPLGVSPSKPLLDSNVTSAQPPIDPSEHAAALVQEAVLKPTVLPASYAIQENIGDRISRLKSTKPVKLPIVQPKIPQPDPNWTSTHVSPATESGIDPSEHVAALVREAVSKPTELPNSYTILEDIGDRISRLTSPKALDGAIASPQMSQPEAEDTSASTIEPPVETEDTSASTIEPPVETEDTSASTIEPPVETEDTSASTIEPPVETEDTSVSTIEPPVETEDTSVSTIEPQLTEAETKKSIDDTHLEASSSATDVAEAPLVEEPHSDDSAVGVVETLEAEETPDETSSAVVGEPVAVEGTTEEQGAAEPAETKETTDTDAPVAEAEDAPATGLLERISSVVETVATVFKSPDADQKDSESVTEPSPTDSAVTAAPVEDSVEPLTADAPVLEAENAQTPNLLERVSSVIEAVATTLKPAEADENNSEAAVEPTPTVPQQPSGSKTVEIACPSCESTDLKKNGRRHGKPKYVCKACGKQFVIPDAAEAEEQPKIKASSPVETPKAQGSQVDTALARDSDSSKPQSKKKKAKAKGFGKS
jgi:predicted RNA-binding Zn-ribbon protein involved in translation (DUF1610 family)